MAYNEQLADRVRQYLSENTHLPIEEKKMMGGLTFMVNDKMCVGIVKQELMLRLDPNEQAAALQQKGCRPMDFTGKTMKGFVFVNEEATDNSDDLENWLQRALQFNPKAQSSKKKNNMKW